MSTLHDLAFLRTFVAQSVRLYEAARRLRGRGSPELDEALTAFETAATFTPEGGRVTEATDDHPYLKRYPSGELGLDHEKIAAALQRDPSIDILAGEVSDEEIA